jgi:hypothetical protein
LASAGAGAAAGAAAAAAVAQAIRASGAIVRIYPQDFLAIISRNAGALVVQSHGGILSTKFQYLTSYKGLIFYTESQMMLQIPNGIELITADKIWIPG